MESFQSGAMTHRTPKALRAKIDKGTVTFENSKATQHSPM